MKAPLWQRVLLVVVLAPAALFCTIFLYLLLHYECAAWFVSITEYLLLGTFLALLVLIFFKFKEPLSPRRWFVAMLVSVLAVLIGLFFGAIHNDSRSGSIDAHIMQSLRNLRAQAEVYHADGGRFTYGEYCESTQFQSMRAQLFDQQRLAEQYRESQQECMGWLWRLIIPVDVSLPENMVSCSAAADGYALNSPLPRASVRAGMPVFYCVDSNGTSQMFTALHDGSECSGETYGW